MTDLIRRMRFTRHDLLMILTEPEKSAKAYGAAVAAVLVAFLARNGVQVPAEVTASLGTIATYVAGSVITFALAWLTPDKRS